MNNSQLSSQGQNKLQQNVKSETDNEFKAGLPTCGCTKTVPYQYQMSACNQPNTVLRDRNAQKSKATYSAQYQAPHISQQQNLNTNNSSPLNIPNMGMAGYPYCNAVPLYNVSSRMKNNEQNISMEYAEPTNHMQYSCPCSNLPPPMMPCKDDLWDLQFCRWWGWNWIRKREEMMNQKKTEVKANRTTSPEVEQSKNKTRRRRKQDDFFSWCNKLFKKGGKQKQSLKDEDKQQLQELYDTPCSSITFNKCPCPMDDWECRSLNLKGQYEYCCGSTRQTSMSTVIVQNKTRHQRCKQNIRKHQSWVYEKTDSSSSDELCPYVCVCPQRGESSTEESVEYLSMRMAQVKSDCEDNQECCASMKQKETKKNSPMYVCCPCKMQKKQETDICCPCMIKLVYKKPSNCSSNKYQKQKCCPNIAQQKFKKFNRYRSPSPCRSLPVCRPSPPRKVPQLRRFPRSYRYPQPLPDCRLECRKGPKRKYVDCNCKKNKEYVVSCMCEQPRKKIRILRKPKKVYCYYCCCSNCCCSCNKKDVLAENTKPSKSKPEENLKQTADKCISSKSMVENLNVLNSNVSSCNNNNNNYQPQCFGTCTQVNDANFCRSFPIGDCIQDKVYNTGQFGVSKGLQEGLYTSPLTGRLYSLNPKILTVNEVLPQSNLPEPLDVSEKIFNINPVESPIADEEHKDLLAAVCEAIMSSRCLKKERHCQTYTLPQTQFSPRRSCGNHARPTIYKRPRSCNEHFTQQSFDNVDFGSNKTQNSTPATELDELRCKNVNISHPRVSKSFDYKILLSPSNVKVALPSCEQSANLNYKDKILSRQKSVSDISGQSTRYFVTKGKHGPIRQRCPIKPLEPQNYATQQFYNLNLIESEQTLLQISKNAPLLEETYSINSLNTNNSLETNIYETCNKELPFDPSFQKYYAESLTTPLNPPRIQKSSTDNSSGDSGDSFNSRDTSVSMKKNLAKDQTESLIPFNSPRNWTKPPKLTGISMTGLFSTVDDIRKFTKSSRYHNKKTHNRNRFNNTNNERLKKRRLYNSLFISDHPDYSDDFLNLPYNFNPIPNSRSTARNPTIYPSLVLQEVSSDVPQATQTSTTKTSAAISKEQSQKELECSCNKLMCRNQSEKEVSCANLMKENNSQHKAEQATETFNTKAFQINSSKATETHYVVLPKTPQASFSRATGNNSILTQVGTSKSSKASNTVYSQSEFRNSKPAEASDVVNSKKQTDSLIITQVNSIPRQADSSKATNTNDVTLSKLQLANNSTLTEAGIFISSKLPQESNSKSTAPVVSQSKPPHITQSKATETTNTNYKSSRIADSKSTETSNHGQMKQGLSASILFTEEYNSEKEISCRYFNEASSKDLHRTCGVPLFKNVNSSQYHFEKAIQENSEGICVYMQHEPQDFNFFASTDEKCGKSETLLAVVDRISERSLSHLPLAPRNVPLQHMATTSKYVDNRSSEFKNKKSVPKSFLSAIPTPVYVNTTTSPFKVKYAKTRSRDRSQSENVVKEKVLKRESPFSMFCTPVTSKDIDTTASLNNEITKTGSFSRPDRQVVLAKPKKLQVREKRWRY